MMKRRKFIKPEFIKPMGGVDGPAALSTSHRDQGVTNMRKIAITSVVLAAFGVFALPPSPAHAQATNGDSWVSGTGSDAGDNDCSHQDTPCQEIYTALNHTFPNGTIHVLAGSYNSITINKPVEISANQGQAFIVGAELAADGIYYGINVHAGVSDTVRIRGLTINLDNTSGLPFGGIFFDRGAGLYLENCAFVRTGVNGVGLKFAPATPAGSLPIELRVSNSVISLNPGGNVLIKPSNGVAVAALFDNVHMVGGLYGIRADTSGGSGLIRVDVRNSVAKGNTNNGYLAVGTGTSPVHFMIDHSTAENNAVNGAVATGANAFMIVANSTLMGNGTGLAQQSGATVASTGTNTINFNTTNTSGAITPITPK
jgi:hypothetical protein